MSTCKRCVLMSFFNTLHKLKHLSKSQLVKCFKMLFSIIFFEFNVEMLDAQLLFHFCQCSWNKVKCY